MSDRSGYGYTPEATVRAADQLRSVHSDLVEKFLEIAERRVSILDEYGDESWDELPKLVADCIRKIAERAGGPRKSSREWQRATELPTSKLGSEERPYVVLALRLEIDFRVRHEDERRAVDDLNTLSGVEFEAYVARLLVQKGFTSVRGTPATGDQGADLLAEQDGRLFVIQVKRQQNPVGNAAVQEVAAARAFYDGDEGWVMTNSSFTPAAKALAQKTHVKLVVVRGRLPRSGG